MQEEKSDKVTGVVEFVRDITDIKERENKFKKTKERLELAMDAGENGFWDWNLDTDEIYFSTIMMQVFILLRDIVLILTELQVIIKEF